jgi:hypothetical protein
LERRRPRPDSPESCSFMTYLCVGSQETICVPKTPKDPSFIFFKLENDLSRSDDYDVIEILSACWGWRCWIGRPAFRYFLTPPAICLACIYTGWME